MPSQNRSRSQETSRSTWISIVIVGVPLLLLAGYFAYTYWTRPPAVSHSNLKYIQLLRTAVSSQRSDYVAKVDEALHARKDEGKVTPAEWDHFQKIIQMANAKRWNDADQACIKFEYAQLNRTRQAE